MIAWRAVIGLALLLLLTLLAPAAPETPGEGPRYERWWPSMSRRAR